jgi:uncharacterized cupin superfamily protein
MAHAGLGGIVVKPVTVVGVAAECVSQPNPTFPDFLNEDVGKSEWRRLGDLFELSQFGIKLETIFPGGRSSLRHWHNKSDEFVYVISGELVLVMDEGESRMVVGMCVGFKAGVENGHHLINRSRSPASFLVVGTRVSGDHATYSDNDLQWLEVSGQYQPARKDGSLY